MPEALEGVIHGKTIELATDPGLAEGDRVEVVIRRAGEPRAWGEGLRASAGALAHLPVEVFEDLDRIVAERRNWPPREIPE